MVADAIENIVGEDAIPSTPLDIIPAFVDSGQLLGSDNTSSVALGDVDGDGDRDIVEANQQANRVWLNDGTGSFTDSGQALGNDGTQNVTLGDVDGDGDLDIVDANAGPNRVWFNDGAGTFTDSGQALSGAVTFEIALGDVDAEFISVIPIRRE